MPPRTKKTTFPVVDADAWQTLEIEAIGQDEKEWLAEPATETPWLFKPVVEHQGWFQGEDWAEKAVSELGQRMGIPCARIEMARRHGRRGCLSQSVCPPHWEMQPGQVVLAGMIEGYRPGSHRVRGRPGHSLENIRRALEGLSPPPQADVPAGFTAYDVFAGYTLLDAWVANRDRHDENWSILRPPAETNLPDALAASYDHASSLGFNLQDDDRSRYIADGTIERWALRGTAWRFEHDPSAGAVSLVHFAAAALQLAGSDTRRYWLSYLRRASQDVDEVLGALSEMSDPARTFAVRLLETNARRVLDEQ